MTPLEIVRAALARLHVFRRLNALEAQMSETTDALVELDAATNEIAADLEQMEETIAGFDSDTATKIRAAAARLRSLAADPTEPVPPADGGGSDPAPADGAGEQPPA